MYLFTYGPCFGPYTPRSHQWPLTLLPQTDMILAASFWVQFDPLGPQSSEVTVAKQQINPMRQTLCDTMFKWDFRVKLFDCFWFFKTFQITQIFILSHSVSLFCFHFFVCSPFSIFGCIRSPTWVTIIFLSSIFCFNNSFSFHIPLSSSLFCPTVSHSNPPFLLFRLV